MKSPATTKFAAVILAAAALAAGPASAASILLPINLNLTQGGGGFSGQFDVSGLVPDGFTITGAQVVANGFSPEAYVVQGGPPSAYVLVSQTQRVSVPAHFQTVSDGVFADCPLICAPYEHTHTDFVPDQFVTDQVFRRDTTFTHIDNLADSMLLDVGEAQDSGSVGFSAHTIPNQFVGSVQTGTPLGGFQTFQDYRTDIFQALAGPLQATAVLSLSDLAGLNATHLLDFDVSAPVGQFTLTDASLQFDLAPIAGVPEPSTWAMLLVGAAGVGAILRRRRARRGCIETA